MPKTPILQNAKKGSTNRPSKQSFFRISSFTFRSSADYKQHPVTGKIQASIPTYCPSVKLTYTDHKIKIEHDHAAVDQYYICLPENFQWLTLHHICFKTKHGNGLAQDSHLIPC